MGCVGTYMTEKNINSLLVEVQSELKAPKGQYNSFGKYNYRSTEDVLEGLKPILKEKNLVLVVFDDVVQVSDRVYIKSTAKLSYDQETIEVTAFARESLTKKGMDDSQITGTASSYARKYALNGMFLIDDSKDADSDEFSKQNKSQKNSEQKPKQPKITLEEVKMSLNDLVKKTGGDYTAISAYLLKHVKADNFNELNVDQIQLANEYIKQLSIKADKK